MYIIEHVDLFTKENLMYLNKCALDRTLSIYKGNVIPLTSDNAEEYTENDTDTGEETSPYYMGMI